jgi:hypothetical protein
VLLTILIQPLLAVLQFARMHLHALSATDGYHTGKFGFDAFTHLRASMDSPSWSVGRPFFVYFFGFLLTALRH